MIVLINLNYNIKYNINDFRNKNKYISHSKIHDKISHEQTTTIKKVKVKVKDKNSAIQLP